MIYKEINGDLIELALAGSFDVIAHGCNCFNLQGAGIAAQMSKTFETNTFSLEQDIYKGDVNKLGMINHLTDYLEDEEGYTTDKTLTVVNAYTQYQPGANLDYEALTLCLRKINYIFKGKHIGLPQIGCGIADGIWDYRELVNDRSNKFTQLYSKFSVGILKDVKTIIQQELKDCDVTVVIYKN